MADGEVRFRDKVRGLSDLPVRFVSGVVMAAIVGIAVWLGSWWWSGLVILLAGLVLWEWNRLVRGFEVSGLSEVTWMFFGAVYVSAAAYAMIEARNSYVPLFFALGFLAPVVAVDVGAYFAGRAIGGPKIAPSISPSKTWAGLGGGAVAASAVAIGVLYSFPEAGHYGEASIEGVRISNVLSAIFAGIAIAVLAQAGDFFESWMKRRAGRKDSSNLIPGHGGVFDRLDGFLAVFSILFITRVLIG